MCLLLNIQAKRVIGQPSLYKSRGWGKIDNRQFAQHSSLEK